MMWGSSDPVSKMANRLHEVEQKLQEELETAKQSITEEVGIHCI